MGKMHFRKMVLEVSDLDRSEQFYRDDMGLQFVGRDLFPEPGANSSFQTEDGAYVVIVQVPEVKPDGPGVHRNFMLPEDDYWRVYNRLKERGWVRITYMTEMGLRAEGEVTCGAYDPDMHRIQLTAWPPPHVVPAAKQGKVVAGRLDDFPIGSVTHNREGKFFLVRTQEGALALSEICTHRQCNLTYQPEHYRFFCYCHYRRFNRTGRQIAPQPDVPPMYAYPIEFVDGQIVVDTDRAVPRTEEGADSLVPVPGLASSVS